MDDRIHAALDGELPHEALTAEERARLEAVTQTIASAAAMLRTAPAPDLAGSVMREVSAAQEAHRPFRLVDALTGAFGWLWSPREYALTLRPAYGMAGLAVAVLAISLAPGAERQPSELAPLVVQADADPRLYVQFRIEAADAGEVALAGSFTDWEPRYSLQQATPGVWTIMIPLEPGVHDYTFVIDGDRWVVDPDAPQVTDSFGGSNSRLFLAAPADAV